MKVRRTSALTLVLGLLLIPARSVDAAPPGGACPRPFPEGAVFLFNNATLTPEIEADLFSFTQVLGGECLCHLSPDDWLHNWTLESNFAAVQRVIAEERALVLMNGCDLSNPRLLYVDGGTHPRLGGEISVYTHEFFDPMAHGYRHGPAVSVNGRSYEMLLHPNALPTRVPITPCPLAAETMGARVSSFVGSPGGQGSLMAVQLAAADVHVALQSHRRQRGQAIVDYVTACNRGDVRSAALLAARLDETFGINPFHMTYQDLRNQCVLPGWAEQASALVAMNFWHPYYFLPEQTDRYMQTHYQMVEKYSWCRSMHARAQ